MVFLFYWLARTVKGRIISPQQVMKTDLRLNIWRKGEERLAIQEK